MKNEVYVLQSETTWSFSSICSLASRYVVLSRTAATLMDVATILAQRDEILE
jgi:hypothetical protein